MPGKARFAKVTMIVGLMACMLALGACALCHGRESHSGPAMQRYWDK
jgi:hypothetical protein